ncbi:hypothetical protein GGF31_008974 [Allomyces arbusculus]|nr:hypothetical protein GGF31_008974 [Allomyces arbusculus]
MPPPPAARLHADAGAARHAGHHHVHWPPALPPTKVGSGEVPHDKNDPTTPRRPHPLSIHVLDALHAAGGSYSPPSAHPRPSPAPAAPLSPYPMAPSRAYAWYARPDLPDPRARLPKPPNTVANRVWTALLGSDPPRSKVLAPSASTLHVHGDEDDEQDPEPVPPAPQVEPITLFEWIEKVAHNLNPLATSSSSTDSLNQLLRVASDEGMRAMFLQQLDPPVAWPDLPAATHDPDKPRVPSSVTHLAHWLDPAEWLDTDDAPPAFLRVLTTGTAIPTTPTRTRDALLSAAWIRSLRLDQTIVQTARLHAAQRAMRHDLAAWPTELAWELNDLHELVEMVQEEAELVFADSSLPLSRESYEGEGGEVVSASAADEFLAELPAQLWGVAGTVAAGAAAAAGVGALSTAQAVGPGASMPDAVHAAAASAPAATIKSTGPTTADTPAAVPPNPAPLPDPALPIPSTDFVPPAVLPSETTAVETAPVPLPVPSVDAQLDALTKTTTDSDVMWVVVSSTTSLLQHYTTEPESVVPPLTGQDAGANGMAAPMHVLSVIPESPSSAADIDNEPTPVPGIRIQIGGLDIADADSPDSPIMVTAPGSPAVPTPAPLTDDPRDACTAAWLADQAHHPTVLDDVPDFVSRTDVALPDSQDGDEMVVEEEEEEVTSTLSSLAASVRASMSAFSLHGTRVVPPEWAASGAQVGASDAQIGRPRADVTADVDDVVVSTATINSAPRAPAPPAEPVPGAPVPSAMLLPRPKLPSIARSAHSLRVPTAARLPPAVAAASATRIKSELSLGAGPTATAAALRTPIPVVHCRARTANAGSSQATASGDESMENVRTEGGEEEAYYSEASSIDASTASFATTNSDASRGTWRAPARGRGAGVAGSSVVYEEDEEEDDFFDDEEDGGSSGRIEDGDSGDWTGKDRPASTEPKAEREGGERHDQTRGAGAGL